MSDNIERIHEEPLFRCSSVRKTDDDRKPGGYFNFDKRKKKDGKKEDKVCKKPISCIEQKTADDLRGIERKEPDETHPEENRCGKIIDIEA
ncbi:MAG: hypothetical protein HYV59_10625 [Planctomycetes bacterium]|nr:hypothetical protein [Planctomycetota bacterium]